MTDNRNLHWASDAVCCHEVQKRTSSYLKLFHPLQPVQVRHQSDSIFQRSQKLLLEFHHLAKVSKQNVQLDHTQWHDNNKSDKVVEKWLTLWSNHLLSWYVCEQLHIFAGLLLFMLRLIQASSVLKTVIKAACTFWSLSAQLPSSQVRCLVVISRTVSLFF